MNQEANAWLWDNRKKPYRCSDDFRNWYWGTMNDFDPNDPDNEPDETDFLLPDEIFQKLGAKITYPNVRMYASPEDAYADFCLAFAAAQQAGWRLS